MRVAMNISLAISLVIPLLAGPAIASNDTPPSGRVVVRVDVFSRAEVDFVARWIEPWDVDLAKGLLITDVNEQQMEVLRDFGFGFEIDKVRTEKLNRPLQMLKTQTSGIPSFPCYRTVEETLDDAAFLEQEYPDLAELIDIGDSWEKLTSGGVAGYDLMVLKITDGDSSVLPSDKTKLWVQGAIHARELVTAETVLRFGEHLITHFDSDPNINWLLKYTEVYLLLQTNPDGRKMAEEGYYWRKNTNDTVHASCDSSAIGVDLNRNFGFEWGCCNGSSGDPCSEVYRGTSAASEPETQAVQNFLTANFPDWRPDDFTTPSPDNATGIFIDVHSSGGDVFAPTGFGGLPAPNDAQMVRLGRKFSYFNDYFAQSGGNYTVDGSTTDWGYGRLGLPSYTFELGTEFFQQCSSFEARVYPDNFKALMYALKVVGAPFMLPAGPDVVSVMALPSVVAPGGLINIVANADDTRFGPGQGHVPLLIEAIGAAEVTIGIPPGHGPDKSDSSKESIVMDATDGSFDSDVEQINTMIDTSGLTVGKHTVFVRAQDDAGQWGPAEAINFLILEESIAASVSGSVRLQYSGRPAKAIVSAGGYKATTSMIDGSFDLMVPPGIYQIYVAVPGYETQSTGEINLISGAAITKDFVVSRHRSSMKDDVEGGDTNWVADPPWQITDTNAASGNHSWTDSPAGDYADGADSSLTSLPFNFDGRTDVELSFSHRWDFEAGYDYGHLEASTDGGQTWRNLRSFTGEKNSWVMTKIELPEFDGVLDVRIRFRVESDGYLTEDGWYIDDIRFGGDLLGPPPFVDEISS